MSDLDSFQQRGRRQGGGSLSSGQEGDVSDGSIESGTSFHKYFGSPEHAGRDRSNRCTIAPQGSPVWGGQQPDHLEAIKAMKSEGAQEAPAEESLRSEAGMEEWLGRENGWPRVEPPETLMGGGAFNHRNDLSGEEAEAPLEPFQSPGVRSGGSSSRGSRVMKYFQDDIDHGPVEESPRSPLGQGRRTAEQLEEEEASESANSTRSLLADEASVGTSPERASGGLSQSQQPEPREDMSAAVSPSSGEESTSRQREAWGWQLGASPKTPSRKGTAPGSGGGVAVGESGGELLQLRKALAAAEGSARRWKAAATAADAQARGFQVALAATEQTTQVSKSFNTSVQIVKRFPCYCAVFESVCQIQGFDPGYGVSGIMML